MPRPRKWGTFKVTKGIKEAYEDAQAELDTLQGEVQDWMSGMEGTNLENTEKYSQLEECFDNLDSAIAALEDFPEGVDDEREITFSELRKRNISRQDRLVNITSTLEAISSAYDYGEKVPEEIQDVLDGVDEALSYFESIVFPGIYG